MRHSRVTRRRCCYPGADDPVTPPEYATLAQRAFADSKHVIVAGHGHGQLSTPCIDRIIGEFCGRGQREGARHELHGEAQAHAVLHHAGRAGALNEPETPC